MSPIDDELKAALHRRATVVLPPADPLAGIERRATRLQRQRLAASVAGSVLAVAAVATVVPLLGGTSSPPDTARVASSAPTTRPSTAPTSEPSAAPSAEPSTEPTAGGTTSPYALDLTDPWPYRGTPLEDLGQGTVDTITREYAVKRGVAESAVDLVPLWGQVWEPSQSPELVFAATVDGEQRWGYATTAGDAGPEFSVDEPLPSPALALAAALPGDEVARLVVVASPEVGSIQYGPDDASDADTATLADGVATTALEGDPATASYRVLDPSGGLVVRGSVPAVAGPSGDDGAAPPADEPPPPTNVVDWPRRGTVPDDLRERAVASFARSVGVLEERVRVRLLFGGERDGRSYVLLQGWYGGDARVFAYRYDGSNGREDSVLQGATAPGPAVLAAWIGDVLVVVPEPTAGQVLYAPDATTEPQPVPDQGTEVAVLIERPVTRTGDTLLVLDGDGDPERPIYRGRVAELLAALE